MNFGDNIIRGEGVGVGQVLRLVVEACVAHKHQIDAITARESMIVQRVLKAIIGLAGMGLKYTRVNAGGTTVVARREHHRPIRLGSGTTSTTAHAPVQFSHGRFSRRLLKKRRVDV